MAERILLLLERQVSTRRNMSVMFANVARRTQTLVGRQLMLIDELERTEQNPEELERLYRLDHIATRLRRSAEALLVIAGNRDHDGADVPVPLADVIRSAAAEIEGYRSVRLGAVPDLRVVVELVPDLRLVLAELLENATSFSAPGAMVDVSAELREHCVISVVDHGIGMAPARFAEENRRLVDRERLDVAPTKVLGLFVVGRLARRHGLTVRLHPTSGQGVTATVAVPARLLIRGAAATGVIYRARTRPAGVLTAAPESFSWFAPTPAHGNLVLPGPALADVSAELSAGSGPAVTTAASPDATPSGSGDAGPRRGLNKRQPGESLPTFGARADPVPAVGVRDPDGERDAVNAFVDGITRAAEEPAVPQPAVPQPAAAAAPAAPVERVEPPPVTRPMTGPATTRNGLTRRVPGANLGDHARMLARPPADDPPRERDADAERDALVAFLDGLARALPSEPTTGD